MTPPLNLLCTREARNETYPAGIYRSIDLTGSKFEPKS